MNKSLAVQIGLVGIFLAILVGCGNKAPSAFDAALPGYLVEPDEKDKEGIPAKDIKMKLLPIDMDKKVVDADVYYALPEELRATKPEEVGTLIQIRWNLLKPGDDGRKTYQYRPRYNLVDRQTKKFIHSGGFQEAGTRRGADKPAKVLVKYVAEWLERVKK
jgi:hypothetical protein